MYLSALFSRLTDRYHVYQVQKFLQWVDMVQTNGCSILIDLPLQKRVVRRGSKERIVQTFDFIVCEPSEFGRVVSENRLATEEWCAIFKTSHLLILERRDRYQGAVPYYFGLNQKEKDELLKIARETIIAHLEGRKHQNLSSSYLCNRFINCSVEVDVGFWVRGHMRGSIIMKGDSLLDAVVQGSLATLKDARFKPLTIYDLEDLRIEMTILSGVRIPLMKREMKANIIYHNKSYLLRVGDKTAWFLPMAFNTFSFRNLQHLINQLYLKAGIQDISLPAKIFLVETINFIETGPHNSAVSLDGPVLDENSFSGDKVDDLFQKGNAAAYAIVASQQDDGFIPTVKNIHDNTRAFMADFVRFAFSTYALALWADFCQDEKLKQKARLSFSYCRFLVFDYFTLERCNPLFLVYYMRLSQIVERQPWSTLEIEDAITRRLAEVPYEPILYLQLAFHYIETDKNGERLINASNLTRTVFSDLKSKMEKNESIELARYADLLPLLYLLGKEMKDDDFSENFLTVRDWFASLQLEDGSFPSRTDSSYVYTRGVSKIIESLCLMASVEDISVRRCLDWVSRMQYTEDNSFFVKDDSKEGILGAFRSDYFTTDTWTDAAGHYVIALERLLRKEKTP